MQIDLERVTERLTRDKQLEVARREDQITRPSGPEPRLLLCTSTARTLYANGEP